MWIHVNHPVFDSSTGFHSIDTESISALFVEYAPAYSAVNATMKGGKTICLFRMACSTEPGKDSVATAKKIKDDIVALWRSGSKHVEINKLIWPSDIPDNGNLQEFQVYGSPKDFAAA